MGTRISFTFEGDDQVDRTLERFELGATDASPAFDEIGDSLARAERRQFHSEGAYGSGGWAPLSSRYAAWKERHYPGKPILERSGELLDSLTQRPFGIDVVDAHVAVFGSGLEYGPYHQSGAGNLPVRKPIDIPESLRRRWVKIVQLFIVTGRAHEE